jgi:hypothetical protein
MKMSPDEDAFLRRWIYDEGHYRDGAGPAKRLHVKSRTPPADLALLIAAALPDVNEQAAAVLGAPPAEPSGWPWSEEALRARFPEARVLLAERNPGQDLQDLQEHYAQSEQGLADDEHVRQLARPSLKKRTSRFKEEITQLEHGVSQGRVDAGT